jgi:hypothetical protein
MPLTLSPPSDQRKGNACQLEHALNSDFLNLFIKARGVICISICFYYQDRGFFFSTTLILLMQKKSAEKAQSEPNTL